MLFAVEERLEGLNYNIDLGKKENSNTWKLGNDPPSSSSDALTTELLEL